MPFDVETGHLIKQDHDDNATRIPLYWYIGCHGDPYILKLIDTLAITATQFVETGTESGSTLGYVARMYPHLGCFSCEMDEGTAFAAIHHLQNHHNTIVYNVHSTEFLMEITPQDNAIFWLDAHSHGWGCSLGSEVSIVLSRWNSGYILLDDFEVPNRPELGFDWYESYGKLNMETVLADITPELQEKITGIYYPNYPPSAPGTTIFGNRGWCLITFGDTQEFICPEFLTEDTKAQAKEGVADALARRGRPWSEVKKELDL